VKNIWLVGMALPGRRDVTSPEFNQYRRDISALLQQ
jgi:hypothetical protein